MEQENIKVTEDQVSKDYATGSAEVAALLQELPEPARIPLMNGMISYILFQG